MRSRAVESTQTWVFDTGDDHLRASGLLDRLANSCVACTGEGVLGGGSLAEESGEWLDGGAEALGVLLAANDGHIEGAACLDQDLEAGDVALIGHDGVDALLDIDDQKHGGAAFEKVAHGGIVALTLSLLTSERSER